MKKLRLALILAITVLFSLAPLAGKTQESAEGLYKEGLEFRSQGNLDKALESFNRSIEIDPLGNPDAYFYRAKVYESLGKSEYAALDYLKSCELGSVKCAEELPDNLVDLHKVPKTKWEVGDFGYHLDPEGDNTYGSVNVVDGLPETAWVTKDDPSYIFEDMMIGFKSLDDATICEFTIRNGYCKSMDIWKKNSRVKKVAVIINGKPVGAFKLKDIIDEQTFSLGKDYSIKAGDVISFLILETYPGSKYTDVAISELRLDYDIETPYVPMFRGNPAHTGAYNEEGVPEFHRVKWKFKTEERISSPCVVDDVVYFGSNDHNLYVIDAVTGKKKWRFETGNYVCSSPSVVDGVVYVGSHDYYLYSIDASNGVEKWRFKTGSYILSSPSVVDGVVYVGSSDNYLYSIDAVTSKMKWRFETGGSVGSSPSVVGGVVYVGSGDSNIYAIDASTGSEKWRFETGDNVASSPSVVGGVVYVGSDDHYLYAIDASTGEMKWRFETGYCVWSSPSVVGGVVYVGSGDGNIYAIDASAGKEKWRFKTREIVWSSPSVVDSVVYVGSYDNYLYAIDAATGKEKWRFDTGDLVSSSPSVVDGVVYVGSVDGYLYAIE